VSYIKGKPQNRRRTIYTRPLSEATRQSGTTDVLKVLIQRSLHDALKVPPKGPKEPQREPEAELEDYHNTEREQEIAARHRWE
jgi:hypothetical protein